MRAHRFQALGLGSSVLLCGLVGLLPAGDPEPRSSGSDGRREVRRVSGAIDRDHDLAGARRPSASEAASRLEIASGLTQAPALSTEPMLSRESDQTGSIHEEAAVRGVPSSCGDTFLTQNLNTTRIDLFPSMVRCAGGGVSTKNSWARCYTFCNDGTGNPTECFPGDPENRADDFIIQCIKFGVQDNRSPLGLDWEIDVRLVALTGPLNPNGPGCSSVLYSPSTARFDDWFVPPSDWVVLHLQKVRIPNNYQGFIQVEMSRPLSIPAGTQLLIEIHNESRLTAGGGDGGSFIVGGNTGEGEVFSGGNGTSIWSPDCGIPFYFELCIIPECGGKMIFALEGTFGGGDVFGACCVAATGECSDDIALRDCLLSGLRFQAGESCATAVFDPPCGFVPPNDNCINAIDISGSVCIAFDTRTATDSPAVSGPLARADVSAIDGGDAEGLDMIGSAVVLGGLVGLMAADDAGRIAGDSTPRQEVRRVSGAIDRNHDLSGARRPSASEAVSGLGIAQGLSPALESSTEPSLSRASDQTGSVHEDDSIRGVPSSCGDTFLTQNLNTTRIDLFWSMVRCAGGGVSTKNSWARCYRHCNDGAGNAVECFPGDPQNQDDDFIIQCVKFGVQDNRSPAGLDWEIDVRLVALSGPLNPDGHGCLGNIWPGFTSFDDWFVPPTSWEVLHLQKVRIPNNFQGLIRMELNRPLSIPAGTHLLIEIHSESRQIAAGGDGGSFIIGGNDSFSLFPDTLLWSPDCGIPIYIDITSFFSNSMVVALEGTFGGGDVFGACCVAATGECSDDIAIRDCLDSGLRFQVGETCATAVFDPPCGFVVPNDDCIDAIAVSGSVCVAFDTRTATDGPAVSGPLARAEGFEIGGAEREGFDMIGSAVVLGGVLGLLAADDAGRVSRESTPRQEVRRVSGAIDRDNDLGGARRPSASEAVSGLEIASGPAPASGRAGSIHEEDAIRGVPMSCGDTFLTQNLNTTQVDLGPSTVTFVSTGGTAIVSLARCFKFCDDGAGNPTDCFPGDPADPNDNFIIQCVKFGVQENSSPAGLDWEIDLRLVALAGPLNPNGPGCSGSILPPSILSFNDWFVPPSNWAVVHLQRVRIPNNYQGLIRAELSRPLSIPAGTQLLIEIHTDSRRVHNGGDGGKFIAGSNDGGEVTSGSNGTSLWSTDSGIPFYFELLAISPTFTSTIVVALEGTFGGGDVFGACCDSTTGSCLDNTALRDCLSPGLRFRAGETCATAVFDPPCGFVTPNDDCPDTLDASGSVCIAFDTRAAADAPTFTDPPDCQPIYGDLWYRYTVRQTDPPATAGRLVISTLGTEGFDTIVSAYRVVDQDGVTPGLQSGTSAQICDSIAANDTIFAAAMPEGCQNDIPNRPPSAIDRLTYMVLPAAGDAPIAPGDAFYIRLGSPFRGEGGQGLLNVDYLPSEPAPPWGLGIVGTCCIPAGAGDEVDCQIVSTDAGFPVDCAAAGGFLTLETNFYEGRNPAILAVDPFAFPVEEPLVEFDAVGCKTFPCPGVGEACWNALDLEAILQTQTGTSFGTFTRKTRKKLYFKYQLQAGQSLVIDTCGTVDFDTVLEIFSFESCSDPAVNPDGKPAASDLLVQDGIELFDDNCVFDNSLENASARGAGDPVEGAVCFNALAGATRKSCLCLRADAATPGLEPGSTIVICVGRLNPEREESSPRVDGLDPVRNIFDEGMNVSIGIREVSQCFLCEVDPQNPLVDGLPVMAIAENEPGCDAVDPLGSRTNEGCSVIVPGSGAIPPTTALPVSGVNETLYVAGSSGIFDPQDPLLPAQLEDQDWYEFTLTDRKRIAWRLIEAEFAAELRILRASEDDPCFVDGFVLETLGPCDGDTGDALSADCCPGTYYLTIRARPPLKPADCPSDYLVCLEVSDLAPLLSCCKGDMNNDGLIDGLDLQGFVDAMVLPPALGTGLSLGGCAEERFCRADLVEDLQLDAADAAAYVALLLSGATCTPAASLCEDGARCQLPVVNTGALESDLNPAHDPADPDLELTFRSADSFHALETANIDQVCWYGVYRDIDAVFAEADERDCLAPDNFTITYYESQSCPNNGDVAPRGGVGCDESPNCDIPPLAVFSQGVDFTLTREATGRLISGIEDGIDQFNSGDPEGEAIGESLEYRYTVTHAPLSVVEGTCYWIEIVNDTAPGRCVWRWVFSNGGEGRCYRQRKQNQAQTLGAFDCMRQRYPRSNLNVATNIPPKKDLAFCVNILTGEAGCGQPSTPSGRCCYGLAGSENCVVTIEEDCTVNFNGVFAPGIDCTLACPPGRCVVSCVDGDLREAEGCGFDKNGGCDFDAISPRDFMVDLGTITCDVFDFAAQTTLIDNSIDICGVARRTDEESSAASNNPDRDWYLFDTTGNGPAQGPSTEIILTIEAGFNATVELRRLDREAFDGDGCSVLIASASVFVDGNGVSNCLPVELDAGCLPEGEYAVRVVGSGFATTIDCPEAGYRLNVRCRQCCFFEGAQGNPDQVCHVFDDQGTEFFGFEETEPADAETNNGCDQDFADPTNAFEPLPDDPCNPTAPFPFPGILLCGTSWADGGTQDEDWWGPITLTEDTFITVELRAEMPIGVQLREVGLAAQGNEGDCLLQDQDVSRFFATSGECQFDSFTECIPPGNWAIVVIPRNESFVKISEGTPPGSFRNHYQVRIACGDLCSKYCPLGHGGQAPELPPVVFDLVTVKDRLSDLNPQANTRSADNFLTLSGGNLTQVTWWGFYETVNGESCNDGTQSCDGTGQLAGDSPDDFIITLFNDDNCGLVSLIDPSDTVCMPGSLFAGSLEQDVDFTLTKTETGLRDLLSSFPDDCRNEYQFEATLNVPIALAAETCYWLQIANRSTGACLFRWEVSPDGESHSAHLLPDPADPFAPQNPDDGNWPPRAQFDGSTFTTHDLAFCVSVEIGPTGCFDFQPAANNDCAGALEITCTVGQTQLIDFDLLNYDSLQDPEGPNPCVPQLACEPISRCNLDLATNRDPSLVPRRESSAWFLFQPQEDVLATITKVGDGAGVLATMTVFSAGTTCNDFFDINGDLDESVQAYCDANGAPPFIQANFTAGQEYLILLTYHESTQWVVTQSIPQTLSITCE